MFVSVWKTTDRIYIENEQTHFQIELSGRDLHPWWQEAFRHVSSSTQLEIRGYSSGQAGSGEACCEVCVETAPWQRLRVRRRVDTRQS